MKIRWHHTWIFLLLIMATPLLAYAIYNHYQSQYAKLPVYAVVSEMPGENSGINDFKKLLNQNGKVRGIEYWEDKIMIVNFFFTHCPVICVKMTHSLKRISEQGNSKDLLIASITVDPERDTPQRMRDYIRLMKIQDNNWDLLTGEKQIIYKLARNTFRVVATDGDGGTNDFIHSEKLVLVDKQKKIRGYYDGTDSMEINQLIKDLKKLKNEE